MGGKSVCKLPSEGNYGYNNSLEKPFAVNNYNNSINEFQDDNNGFNNKANIDLAGKIKTIGSNNI